MNMDNGIKNTAQMQYKINNNNKKSVSLPSYRNAIQYFKDDTNSMNGNSLRKLYMIKMYSLY